MSAKVKGYIDNFTDYFPDYEEGNILPMKYVWNILSTPIKNLPRSLLIISSIKERNKQKVTQESKIKISKKNESNKSVFLFKT